MSKRSTFDKVPKDFYPTTDPNALPKVFIDFVRGRKYAEPCCGSGDLVDLLVDAATCNWESDIEYRGAGVVWDAMCLSNNELEKCDCIITNPPYTRSVLLPLIDHLVSLKDTWLLLPSDLMHNRYFGSYMERCSKVVSIGRLCWFKKEGKRVDSTDNYAWYLWEKGVTSPKDTVFYGRET